MAKKVVIQPIKLPPTSSEPIMIAPKVMPDTSSMLVMLSRRHCKKQVGEFLDDIIPQIFKQSFGFDFTLTDCSEKNKKRRPAQNRIAKIILITHKITVFL